MAALAMTDPLYRLEAICAERRGAGTDSSYTAKLIAGGAPLIARKLGEEAVETIVAALSADRNAVIGEAADLLFHLVVLLGAQGITIAEIAAELERREAQSGLAEKASRGA